MSKIKILQSSTENVLKMKFQRPFCDVRSSLHKNLKLVLDKSIFQYSMLYYYSVLFCSVLRMLFCKTENLLTVAFRRTKLCHQMA